jgi:dTDP-4-amino-4,6-dideoxygalactose transaminase
MEMPHNIPLFGIYRDARMDAAALEVLHSGQIASGSYVKQFADGFGKLVNQANVVTVNDMSSAIQIALRIIGVGPGDEVLAASYACMSTNAPIATCGATAVWVDIDPRTGTLDPAALEHAISPRSKAVIVYHLAGYPADIQQIARICQERGLKLIEDCDNALLATVGGEQVGRFGDFAIFSFYPNRQINATEGGALCCRSAEDAERATKLRRYGIDLTRFRDPHGEIDPACDIPEVGWAATLNNLCSAIGYTQVCEVERRIAQTRSVAKRLTQELAQIKGVEVVSPLVGAIPSYWALLIKLRNRDQVMTEVKRRGVQVSKLHQRTDQYSGFATALAELPKTKYFLDHVLGLPCGWWMSDENADTVVSVLRLSVEMFDA